MSDTHAQTVQRLAIIQLLVDAHREGEVGAALRWRAEDLDVHYANLCDDIARFPRPDPATPPATLTSERDAWARERNLPTWAERTDGWERADEQGRLIRARVSRFHGPIISVNERETAYLGWDGLDALNAHLGARRG